VRYDSRRGRARRTCRWRSRHRAGGESGTSVRWPAILPSRSTMVPFWIVPFVTVKESCRLYCDDGGSRASLRPGDARARPAQDRQGGNTAHEKRRCDTRASCMSASNRTTSPKPPLTADRSWCVAVGWNRYWSNHSMLCSIVDDGSSASSDRGRCRRSPDTRSTFAGTCWSCSPWYSSNALGSGTR